jgi:two-component system sensor histidine kinase KdpD
LKSDFLNMVGEDVADTLLEYARANNVTTLVLGHGTRRWNRPWRRQASEQIARANPELGILLVTTKSAPPKRRRLGKADSL